MLGPEIVVRPTKFEIDDIMNEINETVAKNERVLITTLTKKMSDDLTDYLKEHGLKVQYLHSEVKTLERIEIIRELRQGVHDVLIGINLLREGLDIPEVSLVAILDADKEGFLRSERSLIQTIGRAARNANGTVIMYANKMTDSMNKAIDETKRRRTIQMAYNDEHGITPQTISKKIPELIRATKETDETDNTITKKLSGKKLTKKDKAALIEQLELEMKEAARALDFERAAELRDAIFELKS